VKHGSLEPSGVARRDQPLHDLQRVHARLLGLHADSGHGGRAVILCAGAIHGALDRLFEDVLSFEESFGAAR
jgi:hypothetical protein